jgi:hypothetical protein
MLDEVPTRHKRQMVAALQGFVRIATQAAYASHVPDGLNRHPLTADERNQTVIAFVESELDNLIDDEEGLEEELEEKLRTFLNLSDVLYLLPTSMIKSTGRAIESAFSALLRYVADAPITRGHRERTIEAYRHWIKLIYVHAKSDEGDAIVKRMRRSRANVRHLFKTERFQWNMRLSYMTTRSARETARARGPQRDENTRPYPIIDIDRPQATFLERPWHGVTEPTARPHTRVLEMEPTTQPRMEEHLSLSVQGRWM